MGRGDGAWFNVIRSLTHAALLHDCGHLPYSHAGEAAFRTDFDIARIGGFGIEEFLDVYREQDFASDLSECLSIAIVLSPRFRSFYIKVVGEQDVDARIAEVCSFIGGVPHDVRFPGLANIISGAAVDADKIDYMNRDARECGIPVGVDVSRVFLNSTLININAEQANSLSQSKVKTGRTLRADALGYGGTASVMVTPFNVPSHTLTALWCPGLVGGEAWVPLFLRRGYRKHLVFS